MSAPLCACVPPLSEPLMVTLPPSVVAPLVTRAGPLLLLTRKAGEDTLPVMAAPGTKLNA